MASVNSPIRKLLKPILFRLLGKRGYFKLHCYGKIRDIKKQLVEEKEMVLLSHFIQNGDSVIDIGANYAYYSVRLSQIAGHLGKVYAFEPIPFTCRVFEEIISYFNIENVELFEKGVADKNEKIDFHIPIQEFGALSTSLSHIAIRNNNLSEKEKFYQFNNHETISCEVVQIDDFLLPKLKKLSFVKIDIEGAEYFALKGMLKTIEKFKPVILVEIQPFFLKGFEVSEKQIQNLISSAGYSMFIFDPQTKKLKLYTSQLTDSNYILLHSLSMDKYSHLII